MITDIIGSERIERYDSVDELPIDRFMKFNRLIMIDAGIGSDQNAIDQHDKKLIRLINSDKKEDAIQLVKNRNQSVRFAMEEIHPGMMAYWTLVRSINDKPFYDYSDEKCKKMVKESGKWGANRKWYSGLIDSVKKKFRDELDVLVPERADDPQSKEVFSQRKRRLLLLISKVLNPDEQVEEMIHKIDSFLYDLMSPKSFVGVSGLEVKFVRGYEEMSFILSQNGSRNPKKMTTLEYFQAWSTLKQQFRKSKKGFKM